MTTLPRFTDAQPVDVAADLNALAAAIEAALGGGGIPTPTGPYLVDVETLRKVLDVPETVVPDEDLATVCQAVTDALKGHLTQPWEQHQAHYSCREAALGMAVQVWQSRHAPGGQMIGVDLNPQQTPHLLGPGLLMRFQGLLSPCLPYGGAVVA